MDVSEFVALRNQLIKDPGKISGIKISYKHMFIKAIAQALRRHMILNSALADNEVKLWDDINIGVAIVLGEES